MKNLVGEWIGKIVHVKLRAPVPTPLEGALLKADESGILIEMPKGQTFVPITAILHITVV